MAVFNESLRIRKEGGVFLGKCTERDTKENLNRPRPPVKIRARNFLDAKQMFHDRVILLRSVTDVKEYTKLDSETYISTSKYGKGYLFPYFLNSCNVYIDGANIMAMNFAYRIPLTIIYMQYL